MKGAWRARVHGPDRTLGAGFLVAPDLVLTCAHVVLEETAPLVSFPQAGRGDLLGLRATVHMMGPWRAQDDLGDVAVLRLERAVDIGPAKLVTHASPQGGYVAHGFLRPGDHTGAPLELVLTTTDLFGEWQHVRAATAHAEIPDKGFSGAAVYDHETGDVIGMFTDKATSATRLTGRMLPVSSIRRHWEELDDVLDLPWLSQDERRELRRIVAAAGAGTDLRELVQRVFPGSGAHPDFRSVWDAIRHVAEELPGEDRLRRFLYELVKTLTPEPACDDLRRWIREHLDTADILRAQSELAERLEALGKFDEARERCEEVLRRYKGSETAYGAEYLLLLHRFAMVLARLGDYPQALELTRRTMEYFREHGDERVLLRVATDRARVLHDAGELRAAQSLMDEALERWTAAADPLDVLAARTVRLSARNKLGHFLETRKEAAKIVEDYRALGHELHPGCLDAMMVQATALIILDYPSREVPQNEAKAIELMEHVHRVREAELGRDNPHTLAAAAMYGRTLIRAKRESAGLAILKETAARLERRLGAEHPVLLEARHWYAQGLLADNQFKRAATVFSDVLEGRRRILGDDHIDTLVTQCRLAASTALQGRMAMFRAIPLAYQALTTALKGGYRHRLDLVGDGLSSLLLTTVFAPILQLFSIVEPRAHPPTWPEDN
ncbi:tetratricopeptide repeat protein [Nonomuraea fastidiosa]|uniref:tetratricopeptide repeat protein n=1 Tax=Nonomuraea fastidiosa TaxID=46173 RepID=UPI00366DFCF0